MSLYIFDLDGTVRRTKSGKVCPNSPEDQEIIHPKVKEKIEDLENCGHTLVAASNQSGVSLGYMSEYMAWQIAHRTNELLGLPFVEIQMAFYHEKSNKGKKYDSYFRKPNPGMLESLIDNHNESSLEDVFYIGDGFTDEEAAKKAGVTYMWAHAFFGLVGKKDKWGWKIDV